MSIPCQYPSVLTPCSRVNQKPHLLSCGADPECPGFVSLGLRVVGNHPSTLGPLVGNFKVHPLNHLPVGLSPRGHRGNLLEGVPFLPCVPSKIHFMLLIGVAVKVLVWKPLSQDLMGMQTKSAWSVTKPTSTLLLNSLLFQPWVLSCQVLSQEGLVGRGTLSVLYVFRPWFHQLYLFLWPKVLIGSYKWLTNGQMVELEKPLSLWSWEQAEALVLPQAIQPLEVIVRVGERAGHQPETIGTRKLRCRHSLSWFHPDGSMDKLNRQDTVDMQLND